jgi:hypothetical protein
MSLEFWQKYFLLVFFALDLEKAQMLFLVVYHQLVDIY